MTKPDTDRNTERPIVVDAYGVKLRVTPGDLGDDTPKSWADVREQVGHHLIRLAAAPTRLVVEVIEGATRLVRGLGGLAASIANRIDAAHLKSDRDENLRQQIASVPRLQTKTADSGDDPLLLAKLRLDHEAKQATDEIESILQSARSRGLEGYATLSRNGKLIVVLGLPPGARTVVEETVDRIERGKEP